MQDIGGKLQDLYMTEGANKDIVAKLTEAVEQLTKKFFSLTAQLSDYMKIKLWMAKKLNIKAAKGQDTQRQDTGGQGKETGFLWVEPVTERLLLDTWVQGYQEAQQPNVLHTSGRTPKYGNPKKYPGGQWVRQATQRDGGG